MSVFKWPLVSGNDFYSAKSLDAHPCLRKRRALSQNGAKRQAGDFRRSLLCESFKGLSLLFMRLLGHLKIALISLKFFCFFKLTKANSIRLHLSNLRACSALFRDKKRASLRYRRIFSYAFAETKTNLPRRYPRASPCGGSWLGNSRI